MADSQSPRQPPTEAPPEASRSGVPPRRSSLRKAESTRRTPPQSSSESVQGGTPRRRTDPSPSANPRESPRTSQESNLIKAPQNVSGEGGTQNARASIPRKGSPPASKSLQSSPTSSQELADVPARATGARRESDDPRPQTAESLLDQSARQPSQEPISSREERTSVMPPPSAREAGRVLREGEAIGQGLSVETPTVVRKGEDARHTPTEKASTRRKDATVRSSRLSAADEKMIASSQRVERLEKMLLVPSKGTVQSYLPSLENPKDLRKFVEGELALSIYRRLENLAKTAGLGAKTADVQLNPFWIEPSNRDKNEKVLKLIYELLFGMSDEDKSNEVVLRQKTTQIEEAFKEVYPEVSSSWAQTVLIEMSRLRSQAQMLAWIGGIMQKRCRTAVLSLDARVNKLQYSLEGPLNYARIMEGWTEIESRKTYVLENEDVIRFITDQCRRIDEMNTVSVSHMIPSTETISGIRARLDKLQDEVAMVSKQVAEFDEKLMEVSSKIQTANQLFTSIVLEMAA